MTKKIKEHFKKNDQILFSYIEKIELLKPKPAEKLFSDLCESIIQQQLSDKAGATIFGRFKKLFSQGKITPGKLLRLRDEEIRSSGTSYAKIKSLKDLASKIKSKELDLESLKNLTDEEIIKELIKVRGIGRWTAEMFLMFALGREDIFSHGDLGLRNAIIKIYNLKKIPSKEKIEKIVVKWIPYRTYACRILWESSSLK